MKTKPQSKSALKSAARKFISPIYIRKQLEDLTWLYENTGISQEDYDAHRVAILAKMEIAQ